MLTRKQFKIGLALGGGVVRGMAHVGVLRVLLESQIPIDMVAGTSAGSIVGAIFCAGLTIDEIQEKSSQLSWWRMARPVWPRQGFVSFDPMEKYLVRQIGDLTFDELKIPFAVVATDLKTAEAVEITTGRVAPAVHASCAVPGAVVPVSWNGRLLGDGCLVDTVPVRVLRRMGADFVIGVDIFTPAIRPRLGALGMGFNALEILLQKAGGGTRDADLLINPGLGGKSYLRFSTREKLFLAGAQATSEKVEALRELLAARINA